MSKQIYNGQNRYTFSDIVKEVQHQYASVNTNDAHIRVKPQVVDAVIRTFFEDLESHLVNRESVSIMRFGKFETRDSRPDNFGVKKTNKSKKRHKYQSIKFTAARSLKERATKIRDGLNE